MAYVAINPAFLERVTDKIRGMSKAEQNTLGNPPIPAITPTSDYFINILWGEHKHLLPALPAKWKHAHNEFRLTIVVGEEEFQTRFETKGFGDVFPPYSSWYDDHKLDVNEALEYHDLAPLAQHYIEKAEIIARWDAVETKVIGFLRECKSLNEAVKLWPDLVTYIDKGDIERLQTKREKVVNTSRAAEALAALNTDELMGAAVIARLSGAEV